MALTDYISSDRQKTANEALRKNKPKTIQVYVEGFEDIGFWYSILNSHFKKYTRFELRIDAFSTDTSGNGKTHLEKWFDKTGDYLIICLDSDYHYLLADYSKTGQQIKNNRYIFQTYTYAIENLKCYAESLADICLQATHNTDKIIDFVLLLRRYSEIIYPLLIWNLYFSSIQQETGFTLHEFCKVIHNAKDPDLNDYETILNTIHQRVQSKLNQLETFYSNDTEKVESLAQNLKELGLNPDNAYLFIQGHELYDFVLRFIKVACKKLKDDNKDDLKSLNKKEVEKEYHNATNDFKPLLATNMNFKDCFLFHKIEADIRVYLLKSFI